MFTNILAYVADVLNVPVYRLIRMAIATHLLSQMMGQKMENKEAKVKAAYEYADLIMKG